MPTVLIVDDEKNIRATLARGLRLSGYRTEEAENGVEALRILDVRQTHERRRVGKPGRLETLTWLMGHGDILGLRAEG